MSSHSAERMAWIERIVLDFWASAANTLGYPSGEKAWARPHLAVARGGDPLYEQLKADIGPFFWTPEEAFALAFPDAPLPASRLSVISYILPQTALTRADQRLATEVPAERWARSRFFGEEFNCALRLHLAGALTGAGFPAVAPERLPGFAYRQSEKYGLASNWSERHTAWIAGHGTFGLSDGLITPLGKAVRFGSVVAAIDLEPTPRPYAGHQDWCLWYAKGTCGACIRRCPAAAITEAGHDKEGCFAYIRNVTSPYTTKHYGTGATSCGLCQVRIPCEAKNPLQRSPQHVP